MGRIKVQYNTFSDESVLQESVTEAAAASSNAAVPASVSRDGNGKLVSAVVAIPTADSAGLALAKAKISANPGVAVALEFPQVFTDDAEAQTLNAINPEMLFPGVPRTLTVFPTASSILVTNSSPLAGTQSFKMSHTASSLGSALGHQALTTSSWDARNILPISQINIAEFTMLVKNESSGRGDRDYRDEIAFNSSASNKIGVDTTVSNNWIAGLDRTTVDLGVPSGTQFELKVRLDAFSGTQQYFIDGVLKHTIPGLNPFNTIELFSRVSDRWLSAQTHTPTGILIDDLNCEIIDADF